MTAQGHPRTIFKRAIERSNVAIAETTARELGRLSLDEALALTALVARHEPTRRSRFAVRWLERLLEEGERPSIEEAAAATSSLAALGGRGHQKALATLSAMAEKRVGRGNVGGQRREWPGSAGEARASPNTGFSSRQHSENH